MAHETDHQQGTETHRGHEKAPFLNTGMLLPFILVTSCFAAWGVAANMTDPLVGIFRNVFTMSTVQSALVQSAYYGAYFLLAIPASFLNYRFSYKIGVLTGLGLAAIGGFLFIPASNAMVYGLFLAALFTLAAGLSILETSANPLVMTLGPESNATRRLNFAQAFNPVGTNLGVLLVALFILPNITSAEKRDQMSQAEAQSTMSNELTSVMAPYVGLAIFMVLIWIGIAIVKIPDRSAESEETESSAPRGSRLKRLLTNKHYSFGVAAQYFNVAAQTCIWTYTTIYVADAVDASESEQGWWLQASLIVFLVARFVMVGLMGVVDSRVLMLVMCALGVVLCVVAAMVPSLVGAVAVVAVSASLSLLFPTIYGIALEGLGDDTKFGAAGLVMAIVGGATMPLLQGAVVDATSVAVSYLVPAGCFAMVIAYGVYVLKTPRPVHESA